MQLEDSNEPFIGFASTNNHQPKTSSGNGGLKLMPGISWKQDSVIIADFTCRGRREQAILGIGHPEAASPYAILAVFLDGLDKQPELIRDSVHVAADVKLTTESLDYDPQDEVGVPIEGFQRSKTCKGLNLGDGNTDSLHIYWDHVFRDFQLWRR